MSKKEKIYTIKTTVYRFSRDSEHTTTGTLEELIEYFKYTLEVGNSWKSSIKTNPKSIKSFLSNLEKSLEVKTGFPSAVELIK